MKVLVGMSGGVDSSVTAYLLKKQGHDVVGLSLLLFESRGASPEKSCCSLESLEDAAKSAAAVGVEHYTLDARDIFVERVIEPFAHEYTKGMTPNPCIMCNMRVKFPLLLSEAHRIGADMIATGHYARVQRDGTKTTLLAGLDPKKDQSYVLYGLAPGELNRLTLPLGGLNKTEVRKIAHELALASAKRPESQEICFVPDDDYAALVKTLHPDACHPGDVLDEQGKTIGTHKGICAYTIGQRKGLGVNSLVPLYVTSINASSNTISVGQRGGTMKQGMEVCELNWLQPPLKCFRAGVKIRSTMSAVPAQVELKQDAVATVTFDEPAFAPTPGQAAVFYDGQAVMGGGVITRVF